MSTSQDEERQLTWSEETMQIINRLTPDIKEKAFDPDWFLLRQRFEEIERQAHEAQEPREKIPVCLSDLIACGPCERHYEDWKRYLTSEPEAPIEPRPVSGEEVQEKAKLLSRLHVEAFTKPLTPAPAQGAEVDEPMSKLIGDLKVELAEKDEKIERLRGEIDCQRNEKDIVISEQEREIERLRRFVIDAQNLLTNVCQILAVVKGEWGPTWSTWDQEQRDNISAWLKNSYEIPELCPYKAALSHGKDVSDDQS